ncbi:hypothetical protein FQR65_LT00652 [Abscondita terminalis]|nr:hypothetical protein FQR65_LT00652 [Abscondita terminalis]
MRCDLLAAEIVSLKHTVNEKFQRLESLLLSIASGEQPTQQTSTINIEDLMNMEVENDVLILENQIDKIDFRMQLETYFFLIGGNNLHKCIYNILKKLFSPQLTLKFSAMGKGEKKSFIKLKCYEIVKAAV